MEFSVSDVPAMTRRELSGMVRLTGALLDVLDAAEVMIDGFSDCNELSPEAKAALADLQAMALVEHE